MRSYVLRSVAAMATAMLVAAPAAAQAPTMESTTMPTIGTPATSSSPYSDPWTPVYVQMEQYDAAVEKAAREQAAEIEDWTRQHDAAVEQAILERVRQLGKVQPPAPNPHDANGPYVDPWKPVYEQMERHNAGADDKTSGAAIAVAVLIGVAAFVLVGMAIVGAGIVAVAVFVIVRSSRRRVATPSNVPAAAGHATT